ncbi:TPA_asm: hypothetical protein GY030_09215 [Listeria monocytogenes]|nr:hypothetical protein [Listeria monocytogenes]
MDQMTFYTLAIRFFESQDFPKIDSETLATELSSFFERQELFSQQVRRPEDRMEYLPTKKEALLFESSFFTSSFFSSLTCV